MAFAGCHSIRILGRLIHHSWDEFLVQNCALNLIYGICQDIWDTGHKVRPQSTASYELDTKERTTLFVNCHRVGDAFRECAIYLPKSRSFANIRSSNLFCR